MLLLLLLRAAPRPAACRQLLARQGMRQSTAASSATAAKGVPRWPSCLRRACDSGSSGYALAGGRHNERHQQRWLQPSVWGCRGFSSKRNDKGEGTEDLTEADEVETDLTEADEVETDLKKQAQLRAVGGHIHTDHKDNDGLDEDDEWVDDDGDTSGTSSSNSGSVSLAKGSGTKGDVTAASVGSVLDHGDEEVFEDDFDWGEEDEDVDLESLFDAVPSNKPDDGRVTFHFDSRSDAAKNYVTRPTPVVVADHGQEALGVNWQALPPLLVAALETLSQSLAVDVCVMQVEAEFRSYADFVVVATGHSPRHLRAMADDLQQAVPRQDNKAVVAGKKDAFWSVVHLGTVVVHMFVDEARQYYDLEDLWIPPHKVTAQHVLGVEQGDVEP